MNKKKQGKALMRPIVIPLLDDTLAELTRLSQKLGYGTRTGLIRSVIYEFIDQCRDDGGQTPTE